MAKLENSKPGCFSGFLRVLLCAGNGTSPPVYPSDHVDEKESVHPNKDKQVYDTATPGVVARLMGLDSLPKTNLVVKGATLDAVPRSRSVNFVDYLLEFDPGNANNNHRRVKTSASFREVPSLLQRQNHDVVVFDIDYNAAKVQEGRGNLRKLEMGLGELNLKQGSKKNKEVVRERVRVSVSVKKERNQGKNKKISKLKNEPRRVPSSKNSSKVRNHGEAKDFSPVSPSSKSCTCSYRYSGAGSRSSSNSNSSSPLKNRQKKGLVEPKIRNNMRNQQLPKKIETENSLENLSPVSVLDNNDYHFLYGIDFLNGTSTLASKSKWKSSMPVSLDYGIKEGGSNNKGYGYTDINREAEYYSDIMLKLRALTEEDIIRESDCETKRMCETESFEEICLVFQNKILDLLLYEVVSEL